MSSAGRPRLAIVGVGLIGGSVGLAAKAAGLVSEVIAVDANPAAGAGALEVGAADRATTDLREGLRAADLIVLAIPVPAVLSLLPQLPDLIAPHAIVTDVGSVKGPIAEAGQAVLGSRFIPGHPMAGSERHGIYAARATLFQNATWVVTPSPDTSAAAVEKICEFVAGLEARPLLLTPEDHDRAVSLTSHLPHVLAYSLYAQARAEGPESPVWQLAAGGFHSATRVAASSPEMWAGICLANREAVLASLRRFIERLGAVATVLEAGDRDAIAGVFRDGFRESA